MSVINKIRMTAGAKTSAVIFGRTVSCAVGSTIDVAEQDADALEAQGFLRLGVAGPTSQRPTYPPNASSDSRVAAPPVGYLYLDTTLGKAIRYSGSGLWVDLITGASA